MLQSGLRDGLGDPLYMLAGMIHSPLIEAIPLRARVYPGYEPSSFRLRYEDGRVLKGRRFRVASQAAVVEHLSRHLEGWGIPAVVGRLGAAMLTEWIEGRPLDETTNSPDVLRTCGRLHAQLHEVRLPNGTGCGAVEDMAERRAKVVHGLGALAAAGLIERDERARLLDAAIGAAPTAACRVTIVHRDYCAENLVTTPSGAVRPVDNETVGIGARDYDLARTWYRWPMTPRQREAYLEGYRSLAAPITFVQHFPFWLVASVADGAVFRFRRDPEGAAAPLRTLRGLLDQLRASASMDALLLTCGGPGAA